MMIFTFSAVLLSTGSWMLALVWVYWWILVDYIANTARLRTVIKRYFEYVKTPAAMISISVVVLLDAFLPAQRLFSRKPFFWQDFLIFDFAPNMWASLFIGSMIIFLRYSTRPR